MGLPVAAEELFVNKGTPGQAARRALNEVFSSFSSIPLAGGLFEALDNITPGDAQKRAFGEVLERGGVQDGPSLLDLAPVLDGTILGSGSGQRQRQERIRVLARCGPGPDHVT